MMSDKSGREKLMESPEMKEKYTTEYTVYQPDFTAVQNLKSLLADKEVIIVLGTWCSDSRLHVPHFYKILDQTGIAENAVTLIFVDESKQVMGGLTENLNIEKVPTFMIRKNQKEIARITESPLVTLEHDMVKLLNKNN